MNKNFENYKNTYSALRPSDEAIERAMNMTNEKQKISFKPTYKRLVAAALALVLFIGGGFGVSHFTNKGDKLTVLVAYAESPEYVSPLNEQGLFYGIYVAPLDNKTEMDNILTRYQRDQAKLALERENLPKNIGKSYGNGGGTAYSPKFDKHTAAFYTLQAGSFALSLDDYSDVKSFKVENSSSYGVLELSYVHKDKLPEEELEYLADIENLDDLPEKEQQRILDEIGYSEKHIWELTGDELRYSKDSGSYECGFGKYVQNKGYDLYWTYTTELKNAIGDNPDFDLSEIKDTITFTVTFNDGTVKNASLNLYFDKDGYMHFE